MMPCFVSRCWCQHSAPWGVPDHDRTVLGAQNYMPPICWEVGWGGQLDRAPYPHSMGQNGRSRESSGRPRRPKMGQIASR
eukprot:6062795-Pyramimonas_sp.AAC.1